MTTTEPPHFDGREMEMMRKMFRREFALMPGLARDVPDRQRDRTQVVADHLAFVNTALHNHHHFEDTFVWPLLLVRGAKDIAPHIRTVQDCGPAPWMRMYTPASGIDGEHVFTPGARRHDEHHARRHGAALIGLRERCSSCRRPAVC